LPLIVSRRTIRQREQRGDRAMVHLRESDVFRNIDASAPDAGQRARPVLRRVGGLLQGFQFTSIEQALPALSRTASVIES
jgi:hypothetical protein